MAEIKRIAYVKAGVFASISVHAFSDILRNLCEIHMPTATLPKWNLLLARSSRPCGSTRGAEVRRGGRDYHVGSNPGRDIFDEAVPRARDFGVSVWEID